jgi:nitroreductase
MFTPKEILLTIRRFFTWRNNMDLQDVITNRRSIRTFKKKELPQVVIEKLLDAARLSPSAGNVQPWAFVVVSSQKTKHDLAMAAFGQKDLEKASIVIVVCADEKRAAESYGVRVKRYIVFKILPRQFKTSC